ncbi:hypothetical protein AVEN_53918-1 [Araneus ventricosus]|uniref:Uncharacterized protein n=1 Tax=Araneus ventricosus TaxID=182803 RepID=A0A4Y2MHH6_ARAVE|nr:hypothetical protein AVEN_53918-1 [Araneus ventricosus]
MDMCILRNCLQGPVNDSRCNSSRPNSLYPCSHHRSRPDPSQRRYALSLEDVTQAHYYCASRTSENPLTIIVFPGQKSEVTTNGTYCKGNEAVLNVPSPSAPINSCAANLSTTQRNDFVH